MRHARPLTRVAAAEPVSPLQAKMDYIMGVIDVVIAFFMQKESAL